MGLTEGQLVACPDCRALVPDVDGSTHAYLGGSAGCWAVWGELQARGYVDLAAAAVMPLAVDAYAAQHPGLEGRRQAQSVWVHLVSLCAILEQGLSPADGIRLKHEMLRDHPVFSWLQPPADPGSITVLDATAADAEELGAVVRRWATSVWEAWAEQHGAIRERTVAELAGR
jgi:hypothetical protein